MGILILGLVLVIGLHSIRIFAEGWRTQRIAAWGEKRWKLTYAALSVIGLALVVWGYSLARQNTALLWQPPTGIRHLAALLTWVAFVLVTAADVPRNHIKATLGHPMLLGVKVWALSHLLSRGTLAAVVLFGSFLLWAVLCFRAARKRDRAASVAYAPGQAGRTVAVVLVGTALWALFAFWLHGAWLSLRPFG